MKKILGSSLGILAVSGAPFARADEADRFDGVWETVLSCPNTHGALGFSHEFPTTVKHSVLHGEKGSKDHPGYLALDGKIQPDGLVTLSVSGLVGEAKYDLGHHPAGTEYGYRIEGRFTDSEGGGRRIEGRPCSIRFTKES